MENSIYEENEPEQIAELQELVTETDRKTRMVIKDMHEHKNNLNEIRQGLEEQLIIKQENLQELSETVAMKNAELADRNLKLAEAERRIEDIEAEKEIKIAKLRMEMEDIEKVAQVLKKQVQSLVPAETLYQAEDEKDRLSEQLKEKEQAKNTLEVRLSKLKLEVESRINTLKLENQTLAESKEELSKVIKRNRSQINEVKKTVDDLTKEKDAIQTQRDELQLTVQKLTRNQRRVSDTTNEFNNLRKSLDSMSSEPDVFQSPMKTNTTFVTKRISPAKMPADYIMAGENKKPDSKTVSNLLPKWTSGENVRNYTKRIRHAWEFVKDEFDEKQFCNLVRIFCIAQHRRNHR